MPHYTSTDPLGLRAGLNLYAYVNGNPLFFVDPDGLDARVCCRPSVGKYDHCFVEYSAGSSHTTYGFHNLTGNGITGTGTFVRGDPTDKGGTCGPWVPGDCPQNDCLKKSAQSFPAGSYNWFWPNVKRVFGFGNSTSGNSYNSNTFAQCIAKKCNIYTPPNVYQDAPGWSGPCP